MFTIFSLQALTGPQHTCAERRAFLDAVVAALRNPTFIGTTEGAIGRGIQAVIDDELVARDSAGIFFVTREGTHWINEGEDS